MEPEPGPDMDAHNSAMEAEEERKRRAREAAEIAARAAAKATKAAAADLKQSSGYGGPIAGAGAVAEAAGSSPRNPLITSRAPVSTFAAPGSTRSGPEASPGLVRQSSGAPDSAVGDTRLIDWSQPGAGDPNHDQRSPITYEQSYLDSYAEDIRGRGRPMIRSAAAGIASGEMSDVIRQQGERAKQSVLSQAAGARGVPASAVHRMKMQGLDEANRATMEAASQQQMQAMQMVDDAHKADAQINAQLEAQRDNMINALIAQGVERDMAILQVDASLEQQRRELAYKYWAGRLGASVEAIKGAIESTGWFQGETQSVADMAPIINLLMGIEAPADVAVPTQRVIGSREGEIGIETTTGGEPPPKGYQYNEATGRWELREGYSKPSPTIITRTDAQGEPIEVMKVWNEDDGQWEYVFEIDADSESWLAAKAESDKFNNAVSIANTGLERENNWRLENGQAAMTEEESDAWIEETIRTWAVHAENERRSANGELPMTPEEEEAFVQSAMAVYKEEYSDNRAKTGMKQVGVGAMDPMFRERDTDKGLFGFNPNPAPYQQGILEAAEGATKLSPPSGAWKNNTSTGLKALKGGLYGVEAAAPLLGARGTKEKKSAIKSAASTLGEASGLGGIGAVTPLLGAKGTEEKEAALKRAGLYSLGKAVDEGFTPSVTKPDVTGAAVEKAAGELLGAYNDPELAAKAPGLAKEVGSIVAGGEATAVDAATDAAVDTVTDAASKTATKAASDTGLSSVPGLASAAKVGLDVLGGKDLGTSVAQTAGSAAGGAIGSALGPVGSFVGSGIGGALGGFVGGAFKGPDMSKITRPNMDIGGSMKRKDIGAGVGNIPYSGLASPSGFGSGMYDPEGNLTYGGALLPNARYSDERAKSGIGPSNDELSDFLRGITPIKYDYKPEFGGEKDQYGFSANEVEAKSKIGASLISKDAQGMRKVNTGKASMVGLAASANQQKIIDSQSMAIADLLKRVNGIDGNNDQMASYDKVYAEMMERDRAVEAYPGEKPEHIVKAEAEIAESIEQEKMIRENLERINNRKPYHIVEAEAEIAESIEQEKMIRENLERINRNRMVRSYRGQNAASEDTPLLETYGTRGDRMRFNDRDARLKWVDSGKSEEEHYSGFETKDNIQTLPDTKSAVQGLMPYRTKSEDKFLNPYMYRGF